MNGLKYIRVRCNMSLNDLADALGVTRQALSSWETGRKQIPKQRKLQLSEYFGIDSEYFDEINEDKKKYLLEKAMFRYVENGKETYRYKPTDPHDLTKESVYFFGDSDVSLDERYVATQKKKQKVLEKADEIIRYFDKGGSLQSQIVCINRGCNVYGGINTLMDEMPKKEIIYRMLYYYEIYHVIEALLVAYDLKPREEIIEENQLYNDSPIYDGTDWTFQLAEMFKDHWENQCAELAKVDKAFRAEARVKKQEKESGDTPTIAEQIQALENENREFWNKHPEMRSQNGIASSGKP